jgi:hypothetical protein
MLFLSKNIIYFLVGPGKQLVGRNRQTAVQESESFVLKYAEHQRPLNFINITRLIDFHDLPNKKATHLVMHH